MTFGAVGAVACRAQRFIIITTAVKKSMQSCQPSLCGATSNRPSVSSQAHRLVDADQQQPRRGPALADGRAGAADDVVEIAARFGPAAAALRRVVEEGPGCDRPPFPASRIL